MECPCLIIVFTRNWAKGPKPIIPIFREFREEEEEEEKDMIASWAKSRSVL